MKRFWFNKICAHSQAPAEYITCSKFLSLPLFLPFASYLFLPVSTASFLSIFCCNISLSHSLFAFECSVCVCTPGWVMYFSFHINWLAIMIYKMQLVQFTHRMYVFTKYKWHSQIMLCEMISIAAHQFQFKCMRKAFVALSHRMKCVYMCWWRCQSKSKSALLDTVLHCAHARNKSEPTKATRTN